jgi:hypothetical protein
MKKIFAALALAFAGVMTAASAATTSVGLVAGEGFNRDSVNVPTYGLVIGKQYGNGFGAAAEIDRNYHRRGAENGYRYSLLGSYDVAKFGKVDVAAKAGVAYTSNDTGPNGYGALVGVGARYAVTKNIGLTADARYQRNENKLRAEDGAQVLVGVDYRF